MASVGLLWVEMGSVRLVAVQPEALLPPARMRASSDIWDWSEASWSQPASWIVPMGLCSDTVTGKVSGALPESRRRL